MLKSGLVAKVAAANPHLSQRDVETVVAAILNTITEALARGERVEVRGFCALTVKRRRARAGRNPRTGAAVEVGEKVAIRCKNGRELERRLNPATPA